MNQTNDFDTRRLNGGMGAPHGGGILAYFTGGGLTLMLLAALVLPIAVVIAGGFIHEGKASFYWLSHALTNRILVGQLVNGLALATVTTLICMLIAIPLASRRRTYCPQQYWIPRSE